MLTADLERPDLFLYQVVNLIISAVKLNILTSVFGIESLLEADIHLYQRYCLQPAELPTNSSPFVTRFSKI